MRVYIIYIKTVQNNNYNNNNDNDNNNNRIINGKLLYNINNNYNNL